MYSFQLCADTMKYVHKTLQLHMQSIHLQIDLYTMLTHSVTHVSPFVVLIRLLLCHAAKSFKTDFHKPFTCKVEALSKQQSETLSI